MASQAHRPSPQSMKTGKILRLRSATARPWCTRNNERVTTAPCRCRRRTEAPVQILTDPTPALEHTPVKEREVWSTIFRKDDAVSPNQASSRNTYLTDEPPKQTAPAPTPEIFGRKRSSALPKKTPSSTSPPEKKQTNKRLENRHDNAVEYTNYSPKNYYLSYTTCSGLRFVESPPHPAPERPPEGEIRRNRRPELEFASQSPRSAL